MAEELAPISSVVWFKASDPLDSFVEMWYHVFLWAFFSSVLIHTIAAIIGFATLRKHHVGRFFPLLVLLMGVLTPGTSGLITSAVIAFIYRTIGPHYQMLPFDAFLYGVGQTVIAACISFTRILATL